MQRSKSNSIYIHLPFCDVICHYCDFYTAKAKDARHAELISAICTDIDRQFDLVGDSLTSIYFGGGTPSVTPPDLLAQILQKLKSKTTAQTEITLEANPHDINTDNLQAWKVAGINRLSIGVQSLNDSELKRLGRTHSAEQALQAVALAAANISNTNADLIYAVPEQDREAPANYAAQLAIAGVSHISAYHLTLTPQHFLFAKVQNNDQACDQITALREKLSPLGIEQYEVSNFARPGRESRHNQIYWSGLPYLAFGPSAHGFDGSRKRWQNIPDWEAYIDAIEAGKSTQEKQENLSDAERILEILFTGLRTRKGIDLNAIKSEFHVDILSKSQDLLLRLEEKGAIARSGSRIQPSPAGLLLADEISQKIFQALS